MINFIANSLKEQDGKPSSKRTIKFFIVITMLLLTIYSTIINSSFLTWDILAMWLGYAGYNAYEMRKSKPPIKIESNEKNKNRRG